jgi:hypothetical protein
MCRRNASASWRRNLSSDHPRLLGSCLGRGCGAAGAKNLRCFCEPFHGSFGGWGAGMPGTCGVGRSGAVGTGGAGGSWGSCGSCGGSIGGSNPDGGGAGEGGGDGEGESSFAAGGVSFDPESPALPAGGGVLPVPAPGSAGDFGPGADPIGLPAARGVVAPARPLGARRFPVCSSFARPVPADRPTAVRREPRAAVC